MKCTVGEDGTGLVAGRLPFRGVPARRVVAPTQSGHCFNATHDACDRGARPKPDTVSRGYWLLDEAQYGVAFILRAVLGDCLELIALIVSLGGGHMVGSEGHHRQAAFIRYAV
jgi:hypothetical protein